MPFIEASLLFLLLTNAIKGGIIMSQYEKWNEHCDDCGGFETSQGECFTHTSTIGIYNNKRKNLNYETNSGRIHYSNKGAHIVPDKKYGNGKN